MDGKATLPMIVRPAVSGEGIRVNRQFTEIVGFTGEELAARPLLDWIHADDRGALERSVSHGDGYARARHRTSGGEWVPFTWRVKRHDDVTVALGRLGEERAQLPSGADDLAPTLGSTLAAMAHVVEAKNPGLRCSILLVDAEYDRVTVGAGPSLPAEYNAAVEGLRIGPMVGSCGTAAYWGVPVVVENIAEDPLWKNLRDAAAMAGVAACWSHPITSTNDTVLGAMALYADEPRVPTRIQMDGLEIAARMVGLAIERDRLEEQVRQSAKLKALGILAGGIAHDFNNLLVAILGNAELGLESLPEASEARQRLSAIVAASINATELCGQMLAYAGRGAVSPEVVECNALVQELGGLLQVALSKKAALVHDLDESELGVLADRSQLRQVIMNLITNASEAIGNSEGRIVIGSRARAYTRSELERLSGGVNLQPGEYVELRVSDTGVGMEAETHTQIFDPFFTTKSEGRGLGLAAVKGIVRRHEGVITLESRPGEGTTFSVLLPRVALPEAQPARDAEDGADLRGACILVVDDEELVRNVQSDILESAGYKVIKASDGLEAIEVFRQEQDSIDGVLLDLSMPKLDGDEVYRELRKLKKDVRVLLSSGFTEQEMVDRLHGTGIAGFLKKPASMQTLLAKVAEVLQSAPFDS